MNKQDKTYHHRVYENKKQDTKKTEVEEDKKIDRSRQVISRKNEQKASKTLSCSDLTSQYSKGNTHSDIDSNAHLFFNDKGWPVKVISLTEDSPPKAFKPWPSRSMPSATVKKSPRKEKSIHTLKKPSSQPKSSNENKENRTKDLFKETVSASDTNLGVVEIGSVKNVTKNEKQHISDTLNSDIKTVLDRLDRTVEKFSSEIKKPSELDKGETIPPKKVEVQTDKPKPRNVGRKTTKGEQKESLVCSARSNKYDSKEMKAYIHAKRTERKLQMSEEAKKKQEMMEMQRKKLEILREKALKVLKKSSKSLEESKPKWQGPLGEDNSEASQAAGIIMFESKIPVTKKSKLSIKSDTSEPGAHVKLDNQVIAQEILSEEDHKSDATVDLGRSINLIKSNDDRIAVNETINSENMDQKKTSTKLRLTKNKTQLEDLEMVHSLEKPATDLQPCEGINYNRSHDVSNKSTVVNHLQSSPVLPNNWNLKNLKYSDLNISPQSLNLDKRRTFDIPFPTKDSAHSPTFQSFPDNGVRKRQQTSPLKSSNILAKKLCTNEKVPLASDLSKPNISMQNALKEVQKQISRNEKEGKDPEWLQTLLKPDAFNVLNMVQMKNMLSHQKRDSLCNEKKERLKQKFISVSNRSSRAPSEADETDAPSIESMEEDFKILPDPLRLSDIQLPLPNSNSSSAASFPWSTQSLDANQICIKKMKMKIIKTSTSSFTSEAPPLVLPDSVLHLKLQSSVSQSASSVSHPVQSSLGSVCSVVSDKTLSSFEKRKPVSPAPLSSSSINSCDKLSAQHNVDNTIRPEPAIFNGQIEIGQVLSSAALLLQFHAELNRLDAFDQSLAQVIAAERLYHTPVRRLGSHKSSCAAVRLFQPDNANQTSLSGQNSQSSLQPSKRELPTHQKDTLSPTSESDTSSRSSMSRSQGSEVPVSEHLASAVTDHALSLVSEHLPSLDTRSLESIRHSAPLSLHSVYEILSNKETIPESLNEGSQKSIPPVSSTSAVHLPFSPKNIHFLKVLIEDAEFQRKQHQLLYKTQEDILHANYKAALTELDLRFSASTSGEKRDISKQENAARAKIEDHYKTTIANIRESKNQVLLNWSRRIDELKRERDHLKKQIKNKSMGLKLRSADTSPKKHATLRSTSVTSVVESSSSSEASVKTQAFEDKKRQDVEKEKGTVYNRKKLENELLKKYQEEMKKLHELAREKLLLTAGVEHRSRRDKSTSPLESLLQTTNTRDVGCSITEDNQSTSQLITSSQPSIEEARTTDVYNSESFESPESSETPRQPRVMNRPALAASKPFVAARSNSKSKVLIKVPLSPRLQFRTRHRCSSGSDESLLLSQNETQSEQSDYDYEVRILALKEQKRQRSAELSRLHRELKRVQKEQQKATEESLIKQIHVYDSYIAQTKKQLDEITSTPVVRPQIKHPRVSDRFLSSCSSDGSHAKTFMEDQHKQKDTPGSDVESNSLKSVSEASSTETTIQSFGQTQVAEQISPQTEIDVDELSKANFSGDNEMSEVLSSVHTESSKTLESQTSNSTTKDSRNSSHSSQTDEKRLSENWVDAELFFSELGPLNNTSNGSNKTVTNNSDNSPISIEEKLASSDVENQTPIGIDSSHNIIQTNFTDSEVVKTESKSNSLSTKSPENTVQTEHKSNSLSPKSLENTATLENYYNDFESSKVVSELNELNVTENLDVGSVVSIISQAPSSTPKFEGSDIQAGGMDSSTASSVVDLKSEHNASENGLRSSSLANEKPLIAEDLPLEKSQSSEELEASVTKNTSQVCIEEVEKSDSQLVQSDVDESEESEMIKVFVSSKKERSLEKSCSPEKDGFELNKTFIVSKESENCYESTNIESKAEQITDSILSKLLNECFQSKDNKTEVVSNTTVSNKCHLGNRVSENRNSTKKFEISVDDFTTTVLNKFLQDATDCMLRINESKKAARKNNGNNFESQHKNMSSNQLLEALALERIGSNSVRNAHEESESSSKKSGNIRNKEVEFTGSNESEVFWFDEELQPVSLQTQREAKELRLKQLQIEQEIKQLEQAQVDIPSYYYVREIPNKPPPPYTPPGQSTSHSKDLLHRVPTRQEDIESLVTLATHTFCAAYQKGQNIAATQPSERFSSKPVGNQVYKKFLFDLVKQIFMNAVNSSYSNEKDLPLWERTSCRVRRLILPKMTEEFLRKLVSKKVRVLFGFEPSNIKENMIIQWSRKKRDRVDELLVRESQEEEQEWTDYSKCEVAVKNNVALSMLDSILSDTVESLIRVFQKKFKYSQQVL